MYYIVCDKYEMEYNIHSTNQLILNITPLLSLHSLGTQYSRHSIRRSLPVKRSVDWHESGRGLVIKAVRTDWPRPSGRRGGVA